MTVTVVDLDLTPAAPDAGPRVPTAARPRRWTALGALSAAALAMVVTAGVRSSLAPPPPHRPPPVTATVTARLVEVVLDPGPVALLRVEVADPGPGTVVVDRLTVAGDPAIDAGTPGSAAGAPVPTPLVVPAGESRQVRVRVPVSCARPDPGQGDIDARLHPGVVRWGDLALHGPPIEVSAVVRTAGGGGAIVVPALPEDGPLSVIAACVAAPPLAPQPVSTVAVLGSGVQDGTLVLTLRGRWAVTLARIGGWLTLAQATPGGTTAGTTAGATAGAGGGTGTGTTVVRVSPPLACLSAAGAPPLPLPMRVGLLVPGTGEVVTGVLPQLPGWLASVLPRPCA